MKLNLLTLKFSGESSTLEAPFLRNYFRVSLPQIRLSLILGAFVYAAFGNLDALLMPEQKSTIWFIRFVVTCPVFIGTFLMSFSKSFERYMQPLLMSNLILAGAGIVDMIIIAPTPINYYYYAGLILVFMWGYTFVCVRFLWASLAGWVQVALYEIAAIWISPMPYNVLISNNFFFISANAIGMLACYSIEFYARRYYFLTQQLELEREKISQINQELERRVEKRTADYRIINRALEKEIAGHRQAESQREAALEALRENEERYRMLVEDANDMVFRTDKNGLFTFVNSSTIRITGYEEEAIIGKHYPTFIRSDMRDEAVKFFGRQFVKGIKNTYSEYPIITKDGREVWLGQNTQLIAEDGNVTGFQAVSRDITERKRLEKELKHSEERYRELSIIDDLTQLYNARHFYQQLKMEIDRLDRHEYPLTLLLIDLDDFKVFNDTYGHIEGDQVLLRLGQVIKRCLRKADSAYRYGGEEFTIILPMTTSEEGIVIAERIKEELKKENFSPVPDKHVHLTVSIGLSQYKKQEDMKVFVSRVDHLMYQGKKDGKDRICSESYLQERRNNEVKNIENYLMSFVERGGPEPSEYVELNDHFYSINSMLKESKISRAQIRELWAVCGEAFSEGTMQGFVCKSPHGYHGDYEIMDRIYMEWISSQKHLENWDKFFHWQAAPKAVRNRKEYFKSILSEIDKSPVIEPAVLNIGSGPCRDIYEYKCEHPFSKIHFDCLDVDSNAIKYAKQLLNCSDVTFFCENAFRFRSEKRYDLIWSAGFFDYLDNEKFIFLLRALMKMLTINGKMIISNFSTLNPSRDYMEFGEWFLFHRDMDNLTELAGKAGADPCSVSIESEETGVNLFLTIGNNDV
jgi:extracellular factor (EF) 3-hydroxypalmitic acid methyl ester biosynthesis protein